MKIFSIALVFLFLGCTQTKTAMQSTDTKINKSEITKNDVKSTTDFSDSKKEETKTDIKVTEEIEITDADPDLINGLGNLPDFKSGPGQKPVNIKIRRTTETKTVKNENGIKSRSTSFTDDSESRSATNIKNKGSSETETESTDFWSTVGLYLFTAGAIGLSVLLLIIWIRRGAKWIF